MTPQEFRAARETLGLNAREIADLFGAHVRTVYGWESGERNGAPTPMPRAIAILMRLAVKYPQVRKELGIKKAADA